MHLKSSDAESNNIFDMKKIVFVIEQLFGGGAERVTAALANQLCKGTDLEIHMVVYTRRECEDYPVDGRIRWHVLPKLPGNKLGAILGRLRFLRDAVRAIAPDYVVSLGTPRVAVLLTIAMIGSKIPLILSERNDPAQYPVTKAWRCLRTFSYYLADAVVFQTNQAKDYFPATIRRKGTVICNPITGNLPPRFEGTRKRRIVNFCRLSPQKNLDLMIDAFSDICDDFPEYTLYIYGEGDERGRLEEKIVSLSLQDRISLPGHSMHIYEDIRSAALFVSSSDYEGISNSMLEAIALGVPSICTDCPAGGAGETIQEGENGLLVPVGDRKSLAQAMRRVLSDPELSEKLSLNGCGLRERLSVPVVARQWLDVMKNIAR